MTHEPESGPPPAARRRIEDPSAKAKEGRGGCLITGAVLGIIVGATFAFYGLPPILRHYYGEEKVAAGETYEGDGKVIRVDRVDHIWDDTPDDPWGSVVIVILTLTANKTWAMQPEEWRLEVEGVDDWIPARPPRVAPPEDFGIELGVERQLVLRFHLPEGAEAKPLALHLATPRVKFALLPLVGP